MATRVTAPIESKTAAAVSHITSGGDSSTTSDIRHDPADRNCHSGGPEPGPPPGEPCPLRGKAKCVARHRMCWVVQPVVQVRWESILRDRGAGN